MRHNKNVPRYTLADEDISQSECHDEHELVEINNAATFPMVCCTATYIAMYFNPTWI